MRRLRVAARAIEERRNALRFSRSMFARAAAQAYAALIRRAYKLLAADPQRAGVARHDQSPDGVFLFHLRHARTRATPPKQPRHFIVFTYDDATITIIRVLHESMDIGERVSGEESEA